MENETVNVEPLVSVIIPVYNVEDFVRLTLDSTLNQGMDAGQLEVIAVDDGSTDASGSILDGYAERYDYFRVVHQENSGGPGNPRNRGIDIASGRYLFFLDADDELTENALRDLVRVAESEGSDVVLGKGEGINGRVVPGPVFRATKLDADLIDDNVYRTLSPWKLFRKSLIDDNQIRFLETIRIGEDQPFVARAYLNARKISVMADRPYARLRARGDGTNVTATVRSVHDFMELAHAIIDVIVSETEPGRIRDGMLARPLKRTLRPILQKRFLKLADEEQVEVINALSTLLMPHYNNVVAGHLNGLDRIKMDCAVGGDVDAVRELIEWESRNPRELLTTGSTGIRYDIPERLLGRIDPATVSSPALTVETILRALTVTGPNVVVAAEAKVRGLVGRASGIAIRCRGRETGVEFDISGVWTDADDSGRGGQVFEVEIEARDLADDVWDLFVVQDFRGQQIVRRLGAQRAGHIDTNLRYVNEGSRALGVAYFTRGGGFLSLDIGFRISAHRLPSAQVIGLVSDDHGLTVLAAVSSVTDARVGLEVTPGREAMGSDSPAARAIDLNLLSKGVFGGRLALEDIGDDVKLSVNVKNDAGSAPATFPESLAMPDRKMSLVVEVDPGAPASLLVRKVEPGQSSSGFLKKMFPKGSRRP